MLKKLFLLLVLAITASLLSSYSLLAQEQIKLLWSKEQKMEQRLILLADRICESRSFPEGKDFLQMQCGKIFLDSSTNSDFNEKTRLYAKDMRDKSQDKKSADALMDVLPIAWDYRANEFFKKSNYADWKEMFREIFRSYLYDSEFEFTVKAPTFGGEIQFDESYDRIYTAGLVMQNILFILDGSENPTAVRFCKTIRTDRKVKLNELQLRELTLQFTQDDPSLMDIINQYLDQK